jgi:hypothetical protein
MYKVFTGIVGNMRELVKLLKSPIRTCFECGGFGVHGNASHRCDFCNGIGRIPFLYPINRTEVKL